MNVRLGTVMLAAGLAMAWTAAWADDPKPGGAFDITAVTGAKKGESFCYV